MQKGLIAGYWEWDMKGDSPFDNPELMSRLGYEKSGLQLRPLWYGKISEYDIKSFQQQIKLHINSHAQIPFAHEVCFLYPSSKPRYFLFTGRIVKWSKNNEPLMMMGSYVDTTYQHETERELEKVKGFLNRTNQAALIGGWEIEMDTQQVTWTSGTRRLFGVPDDFVPRKGNFIEFFKEGDREQLERVFELAVTEGTPYDLELKIINTNGEERWTRTIGQPEFEGGKCIRVYGTFQDITRQKLDEEQVIMKRKQLEAFISAAPAALAMLDRSYNYIAASKIWMASYNIDVATIIGKNHLDVFHEISDEWKEYMHRCVLGESFKKEEDPFIRRDGKQEWLRWEIKPWYEEPGKVGGILLFTDLVTERKKVKEDLIKAKEEAEVALEAKSRFLSVMSHEIRTPMNAVIGFSNLLLENPRPDQEEYLKLLKFSADNLMVIINDILSLSKIDEGMVNLEMVEFNLKELLENIHAINKQVITEKNIDLKLHYDDKLPLTIKGDTVRFGQIMTNLVNNAIKFTHSGEVTMLAKLVKEDKENVEICFEVKDTGIGIPKEKQDYVFEIFTQASSETTRKFGGIGLGLAICKRLVEMMGGNIQITSKPGEGSTFYFTLKFKKGETLNGKNVINKINADNEYKTSDALKGVRVLLTEDNAINVLVVKRYLQQWGIECDVAENGQIAVQAMWTKEYDLILMDLQMPVMDGYEASRQIRAMGGSKYGSIPIIAITASIIGDIKQSILASGMNTWISKPFNPAELFAIIKKYSKATISEKHLNSLIDNSES
jgi:PAS domain S-box-containing protein